MQIVHISAEFTPLATVGGLGEAVAGLAHASVKLGHKVRVILPKYASIPDKYLSFFKEENHPLYRNSIWRGTLKQVELILISPNPPHTFFQEETIYTENHDLSRFAYFCYSALEVLQFLDGEIDALHLHDWHTAFTPCLRKSFFPKLVVKKTILTIHNLSYQGIGLKEELERINLYPKESSHQTHLQGIDTLKPLDINLLKSGIEEADEIVTVSPTYAKEILQENHSCGLYETLQKNREKIRGIINGIDTDIWNPEKDPFINFHYSPYLPVDEILYYKKKNKEELQKTYFSGKQATPLIAYIGRLVPQKGLDLIESTLFFCAKENVQFILLGSTHSSLILEHFKRLKENFSSQKNLSIHLAYNEALAHRIYAGADLILIPSLFEPCGLVQLTALRYGTLPIAHKTGGLADTIFDEHHPEKRNGFLFHSYSKEALHNELYKAINLLKKDPKSYQTLVAQAIKGDYSWDMSCNQYTNLYKNKKL